MLRRAAGQAPACPSTEADMFMKSSLLAALAAMAACQAAAAHAADTAADGAADIIVTAELAKRRLQSLDTPSFGIAIAPEQLAAINARNAEDLLRYAPATIVRQRYAGDPNATLSFRNMHSQQTPRALVLVDGFAISNFLGADWDTAPKWGVLAPDDIERIEIVYGPTSARYAGNSMGGTMLVETRAITDTALHLQTQMFGQDYRYYATKESLFGWSADAGLTVALGDGHGLAVSYRHFANRGQPQEWRMAAAGTPYADQAIVDRELPFLRIAAQDSVVDARQDQIRLRGQSDLGGGWALHGLAALLLARDETLHPKSFLRDAAGQPTFVGIAGVNAGVAERAELLGGLGLSGQAAGWAVTLHLSRFDTLRNRGRTSDNRDPRTGAAPMTGRISTADAGWTNVDGSAEHGFGAHALALGASYARHGVDSRNETVADWRHGEAGAPRDSAGGRTRLIGAFAEDRIALGNDVTATFGLRFEDWRAFSGQLTDGGRTVRYAARGASAWSPKAALGIQPDAASELSLSVALASRFPTVRELYQPELVRYGAAVGELDLNGFNPELKPERALDVQLSAARQFGHVRLTVDGYRQDVRDSIFTQTIAIPDATSGELAQSALRTNIGRVRSWGADLVVSAEDVLARGLSLDANLSWIDATITSNTLNAALVGHRFPRIPKWRLNASLRYAAGGQWDLALNLRHQSTPHRNLENDATSKCGTFFCVTSFAFVDLKASRRIGDFRLSAGIDNLLNEKAFVYHPYPGRSFLLSLAWNGGL